jgi:class 3 adenylate cyclase
MREYGQEMVHTFRRFLDELLLSSGQYALFYILLAIAAERSELFSNAGVLVLLIALIVQTALLVRFGEKGPLRIVFSFICPLIFTLIQVRSRGFAPLNMNLLFFWTSQGYFALFKTLYKQATRENSKKLYEFLLSMGTVAVFLFLTFYYDLMLAFGVKSASGLLSGAQGSDFFSILNFPVAFLEFLSAPTHRFVIISSLVFGVTVALCRIRIVSLKSRIVSLFSLDAESLPESSPVAEGTSEVRTADVTILYADTRNFSQLAETYPAAAVAECLNLYFSTWSVIARKYGGVMEKFIGDAAIILFGPDPEGENANQAVSCAVEFLGQLPAFMEEFAIRNLPLIKNVGIGLSCGEVIIGEIGSADKHGSMALGHPVSIASRMESLCREFRQDLMIDQNVYRKLSLENQSLFLLLGEVLIRGRTAPMPVYGLK